MSENNERRLSFSSLNPQLILHRHSSATISDHLSGISTPPLQTSASIPFKWEQEPGKPRPATRFGPQPEPAKSLEPPPCRTMQQLIMNMEYSAPKITQSPSPHSILDGPYKMGRPMFSSSRFVRDGPDPFESYSTPLEGTPYLLGKSKGRRRGLLGKFKGGKREVDGGISGFSFSSNSSCDSTEESCATATARGMDQIGGRKMRRHASFHTLSHDNNHNNKSNHIWTSIYGGLKQVVHWKSSRK